MEYYVETVHTVSELVNVLSQFKDWDISMGETYGHSNCPDVEIWVNEESHSVMLV